MAEKYVNEKKRKLLEDGNGNSNVVNTINVNTVTNNNDVRTVFFHGYRKQTDKNYKCATCFASSMNISKDSDIPTKYIYTGEISEVEFYKRKEPFHTCEACFKYLTIIRPYNCTFLDFA